MLFLNVRCMNPIYFYNVDSLSSLIENEILYTQTAYVFHVKCRQHKNMRKIFYIRYLVCVGDGLGLKGVNSSLFYAVISKIFYLIMAFVDEKGFITTLWVRFNCLYTKNTSTTTS